MTGAVDRFREAVAARDVDGLVATLSDDVVLYNPTSPEPFRGRDAARFVFGTLVQVFEEFTYTHAFRGGPPGAGEAPEAHVFRGRVGGVEVQGVDLFELAEDGSIRSLTVFLRPQAALTAMAEAITARMRA